MAANRLSTARSSLAFLRVPKGELIGPPELPAIHGSFPTSDTGKVARLSELERSAIENAMRQANDNITVAASLLGINRTTLWRKLKRLA